MEVIISIIAVVTGVTLYDYFAARSWQQVTSSIRNNMVFEHRNQEYGAYVLRRDYDKRLLFIMLGLILSIGMAYGSYLVIKNLPEEVIPPPPVDTSTFTVAAPPEEDVPPPPKEELPPPLEKTVAFLPPVVVDEEVVQELTTVDPEVKVSTTTNNVEEENFGIIPGGEEEKPVIVEEKETIYTNVEEDPVPEGGWGAFAAHIQKNYQYPQIALEDGISGKVYVRFQVSSTGKISEVSVARPIAGCPECNKEAVRVVKLLPPWKPGKVGGKNVSSWYNVPIDLHVE